MICNSSIGMRQYSIFIHKR